MGIRLIFVQSTSKVFLCTNTSAPSTQRCLISPKLTRDISVTECLVIEGIDVSSSFINYKINILE